MENKKEFILEGLCCTNCAAKIEKEVGGLSEVAEVNLNFVNKKLSIKMQENASGDIKEKVKKIVASHESSVIVKDVPDKGSKHASSSEHKEEEGSSKSYIIRLCISVVLAAVISLLDVSKELKTGVMLIAYVLSGYEILMSAGKNIIRGKVFDENFLMGIASLGAFLIGDQTEAIAVLVFYGIGEILQDLAVAKSRKNISGLMDIRPDYANLVKGDKIQVVSPEQVKVGDTILVKPGEKIPLDGTVVKGNSYIDTRALTGESVPREVIAQDSVLSGTINTSGVLEIAVTKLFGESTVSKILELVENSGNKKAESEKFITKFARYYTPAVVLSAVAVAILPPLFGFGSFADWLYKALSFLIISCPCALVISIPLSFFGGIGGGAKQGILIKGGNYLDALQQVDTIVFDKTGTLTKGTFTVSQVVPSKGVTAKELLQLAVIAERHSTHPIAQSILSYADRMNMKAVEASEVQITELAGHGVIAQKEEGSIYAGNEKLMHKYGIPVDSQKYAGSIVHVAYSKQYMGYILISDEIKPGVKEAIQSLKNLGVRRTVMLTGDHKAAAKEIAEQCQVDEFKAELLPQDKVSFFDQYKKQTEGRGKIVFIGDGINDAPVLAGADIGIAMGGIGSDAAIEAADVVIMNDDITKIPVAIKIARKTKRIVLQNIIFALGVKALIMILAFVGITSIWFAIFADVGVALLALLNALRAMKIK
jgi:Zn2+/Cd2+-exporting ATPase